MVGGCAQDFERRSLYLGLNSRRSLQLTYFLSVANSTLIVLLAIFELPNIMVVIEKRRYITTIL
jgi:hypothetical protein